MSIAWIVLCVLLTPVFCAGAQSNVLTESLRDVAVYDAGQIDMLIRKLGDARFPEREAAEKKLRGQPRDALPLLMKHQNTDDPEIAERVHRIVMHIKRNADNIPKTVFAFQKEPTFTSFNEMRIFWDDAMATWETKAVVAAKSDNVKDTSATGGSFAQSFVPHTNRISAVAVQLYLLHDREGWLSLEVCEDDNGLPGKYILARTMLKTRKAGPAPPHVFVVFDIPDIEIRPEQTYWLRFVDKEHITNHGLSVGRDAYTEGKYLSLDSTAPVAVSDRDAKFRIISRCDPVPLFYALTKEGLQANIGE